MHELFAERRAGVCLPVASLPGPFGIGEIGDSARWFVDAIRAMRLSVWQFLPLGPTGYGDSPYQPLSTFAGNELLIDLGDLVSQGLLGDHEVSELTTLPRHYVDYGNLIPKKSALLEVAARRFIDGANAGPGSAFHAFTVANDDAWLHDYAMYRILKSLHQGRQWSRWEPGYRRRDPDALAELARHRADDIRVIKVQQFLFRRQWQRLRNHARDRGVLLFGDMPIYIALDSADAWARPWILRVDTDGCPSHVAGVPPDYFSEDGQLWGNPLYAWDHHANCGYQWWIERMRAAIELVDIVRIDHFRGFEAYWAIPATAETARQGEWEPGPGSAIFDAMEAALGRLPVVAEDLGVITSDVVALRVAHGMPGMRVLQFDIADPAFRPDDIDEHTVCYTGTHDNDTTVGWFEGSPDDLRSAQDVAATREAALAHSNGKPATIHEDMVRLAFSSKARLAIAPMQDFLGLGSDARINTPGTSSGNWRWRLTPTQLSSKLCDNVADMVRFSCREQ